MKSAVCDDNDHDSCSGKFYKYEETSRKKIKESCSCSCHYKKKRDSLLELHNRNNGIKMPPHSAYGDMS